MYRLLGCLLLGYAASAAAREFVPPRTQDSLDNPHKGFMLWGTSYAADGAPDNFYGASIYHVYVPWREIETADQVFDWPGFEQRHLDPILSDNPQATFVLRLVADYPDGVGSGISAYYSGGQLERDYPLFLEQAPLNVPGTDYASCDGDGPGRAPDWNHPAMATQMAQLVAALAARYDGDPRITAIQVGLLGLWGEWHQSGCPTLEPAAAIKVAVRDAYASAFLGTPLQTRYTRDPDAVGVEFGFHEDYFPSFTTLCVYGFPSCSDDGDWNLEWGMSNVVPAARDNWLSSPISGESPTTAQKSAWVNDLADIQTVLRAYGFSFLGPAGKHEEAGFGVALNAIERTLGYEFYVDRATLAEPLGQGNTETLTVTLGNGGSAPVYHSYRLRLDLVDGAGITRWSGLWNTDTRGVLPGATLLQRTYLTLNGLAAGSYSARLALVALAPGRSAIVMQSAPRDAGQRVILGDIQVLAANDAIFRDGFGN